MAEEPIIDQTGDNQPAGESPASRAIGLVPLPPPRPGVRHVQVPLRGVIISDDTLRLRIDRHFHWPMIVLALAVLPLLAIELFFKPMPGTTLWWGCIIAATVIWLAFLIEFIVKVTIAECRIEYVKRNWLDIVIILIPVIRPLRAARLARTGKVFTLRGVGMKFFRYMITIVVGLEATERFMERLGIRRQRGHRNPLEMTRHQLIDEVRRLRKLADAWEDWHAAQLEHVDDHGTQEQQRIAREPPSGGLRLHPIRLTHLEAWQRNGHRTPTPCHRRRIMPLDETALGSHVPYNRRMRVALAQLNPVVGDVAGNARRVILAAQAAAQARADVVVSSELVLLGYPPRDLLLRGDVVESCERAARHIAAETGRRHPDLVVIVGHPRRDPDGRRPFRNSVSVFRGGETLDVYDKRLLPGYDVFDEDRYFECGQRAVVIEIAGRRCGLVVCEDLWRAGDVKTESSYRDHPAQELVHQHRAECLLALNASPFVMGKWRRHVEQLCQTARTLGVPIAAVNQVGGNDDLVFDGRSLLVSADGQVVWNAPGWRESVHTLLIDTSEPLEPEVPEDAWEREVYETLVLGLRDYCHKSGFRKAILGISGGIDSTITAVIAVAALGAANVSGVLMPSRYTSDASNEDALELAEHLGLETHPIVSIDAAHRQMHETLGHVLPNVDKGLTDENLQARLRGIILMACSNHGAGLVLATSNKSEIATGYSTLYGDMCGAVTVIGDLLKTEVYRLSRWINTNARSLGWETPPIPERVLSKPPSAELRADQTDQDTLPPYDVLDDIVERFVDLEQSVSQIVEESGLDRALVERMTTMIDRAQYKREQAAVILKLRPRTFGRGRPMPMVMKSTEVSLETSEASELDDDSVRMSTLQ